VAATRFWANVRRIRKSKMSQSALARRLGYTDAKNSNISTWELHSPHVPEPETILKIAQALGVAPAELMKDEHGSDIETPYDILRRALDVESAQHELKRFEYRRTKKSTGVAGPHAPFQERAAAAKDHTQKKRSRARQGRASR
jgi:transcriptional regulator with XRE-family HTH domain